MANKDWLVDLDETELAIDSKLSRNGHAKSPQHLLPRALLESVIGMDGMKRLHDEKRFCANIKVPGADWAAPMFAFLKPWGWDFAHVRTVPLRGSQLQDDTTSQQAMATLSGGGRVLGISQDPARHLPASMRSSADMSIALPQPTGRVVAAVIKRMTGRAPRNLPDNMVIPIGFDEICSCLRPGESATRCVERLRKAIGDRSRFDPLTQNVPHVRDLHGYGEAQRWALDLIEDLDAWRAGEIGFEQADTNVVLGSAPGLGKTTFARSLAHSLGLPLIATSVAAWFANSPGYLDSVIKEIDKVFDQAKAVAPAVLFFDEIDAVPNRATLSSRGADWWLPVITHLLTRLDGAVSDSTDRLVILGATNYPEKLDSALIRPGRLNRVIHIEPPDAEAMVGILRQHLGDALAEEDLTEAGQLAAGSSGAMVVQWVKAARRSARSSKRPMIMDDLLQTIVPEDKRSQETLDATAIHEAAHAVAAHVIGVGRVESLSMLRRGDRGGSTTLEFDGLLPTRQAVDSLVVQLLAGRASEEVFFGEPGTGSGGPADSDLAQATKYIGSLYVSEGFGQTLRYRGSRDEVPLVLARHPDIAKVVEDHLQGLYRRATLLVEENRTLVRAVADELLRTRYVGRSRFEELLASVDVAPASSKGGKVDD